MASLVARVQNQRLILDDPTPLPEGTVIHLVFDDEGDALSADDLRRLEGVIERSRAELAAGEGESARAVLASLRARG